MVSTRFSALLVLFSLFSFGLIGCVKDDPIPTSQYQSIYDEISSIERRISRGDLLNDASGGDKKLIVFHLHELRVGFLLLDKSPNSHQGIQKIDSSVAEIRRVQILEKDGPTFVRLLQLVGRHLTVAAKVAGYSLDSNWVLYDYRFSSGLNGFGAHSEKGTPWGTGESLDRTFAVASGTGAYAWLVSPEFDISEAENVKLKLWHTININQNNRESNFNRNTFLKYSFKLFISSEYKGGAPDLREHRFLEIPLEGLPSGKDFDTNISTDVNLSEYFPKSKTVTVALLFNTDKPYTFTKDGRRKRVMDWDPTQNQNNAAPLEFGGHYVTWSLRLFELNGVGEINMKNRPMLVGEDGFVRKSLEPYFTTLTLEGSENSWGLAGRGEGAPNEFALINNRGGQMTRSLLVSPLYDVSEIGSFHVSMDETFRFPAPIDYSHYKIYYSGNYTGGDLGGAEWIEVPQDVPGGLATDRYNGVTLTFEPLVEDKVSFLFVYNSRQEAIWQLSKFQFWGVEGAVKVKKYSVKPEMGTFFSGSGKK